LHGAVVHTIGLQILRGELSPGETLPTEDELVGDLAVSRTVLREAFRVLAAKGLVEARPKTGTRVRPRRDWHHLDPDVLVWRSESEPDARFLADILELRQILEPVAARLAAARASADEIAVLDATLAEMEQAVGDAEAYLVPDLRFHALLLDACHNELIEHMASTLREAFRALFVATPRTREAHSRALGLHCAIVDAIRAHNGEAAEAAALALSDDTAEEIDRLLDHAAGEPAARV
jgi:DNA-binding FadR family transcriptional regulator